MGKDKKPYILGIDPGISGALAVIDPQMDQIVSVWDVPTVLSGIKNRRMIDVPTLAIQLGAVIIDCEFCIIEDVHSSPNDGHVGAFSFGKSTGILIGMVGAVMVPIYFTPPVVWKSVFGLTSDKEGSRTLASKRYPHHAHLWSKKKDHNRAEAVLLAEFGRRFY